MNTLEGHFTGAPLKILIAENHLLLLETLTLALGKKGFDVTAVTTLRAAKSVLAQKQNSADIVILSSDMPEITGLSEISQVIKSYEPIPVIVMSSNLSGHVVRQALKQGLKGYIPKSVKLKNLAQIIELVVDGGVYVPSGIVDSDSDPMASWDFTQREQEIALLVADGLSNKLIARQLDVAETTIKMHMRSVFQKMGVSNRTQVATTIHNQVLRQHLADDTLDQAPNSTCAASSAGEGK
jgi:DNA-binding NarL/FixJ family response regulator